jgi:hypothetical protein
MIALWSKMIVRPPSAVQFVDAVAATESATSLALFRIAIGLGSLLTFGSVVANGLVPVLWTGSASGGYRELGRGPWLVAYLGGPVPHVVWPLIGVVLGGSLLLTLGIGGRAVALVTALVATNILGINGDAGGSYDELLTNALWLLVLGRPGATLSVSARWRTGLWWPEVQVAAFPRWLAAYQLILMYTTTGLQKVSAYWVPGGDASALYYILQQPEWHRADMSWLAPLFPLTQLATTVTWCWEVSAPVWLLAVALAAHPERPGVLRAWFSRWRVREVYVLAGILMHAVIWATMEVGPFTPLSLAFYTTLYHPGEWERLRTPRVTARG